MKFVGEILKKNRESRKITLKDVSEFKNKIILSFYV